MWDSACYPDEDHSSTVLRAHYAGLHSIFGGWRVPRDPKTGEMIGGLAGVKQHYQRLSQRFGYRVQPPENTLNSLSTG